MRFVACLRTIKLVVHYRRLILVPLLPLITVRGPFTHAPLPPITYQKNTPNLLHSFLLICPPYPPSLGYYPQTGFSPMSPPTPLRDFGPPLLPSLLVLPRLPPSLTFPPPYGMLLRLHGCPCLLSGTRRPPPYLFPKQ